VTREEFEDCVETALEELPEEIASLMDNVGVEVRNLPTRDELRRAGVADRRSLLGLYTGVPLGRRGPRYGNVLPDRVLLYQRNIEAAYPPERLVEGIRRVVLHEVGHHFGLSDARLRQLGY